MQVHALRRANFCWWPTWRSQFQGESSWPKSRFIHSNGCYPGRQAREQYYRTAVAIFKVGGPWLGRTLLHPRVDLVFHYAQVEMQCRLGTSLTRNASAGNDGSGPADPRATMATRKKRLLRRLEWFWTDRLPNLVNRLRSLHRQAMRADRLK
jgi:hypothetical protein